MGPRYYSEAQKLLILDFKSRITDFTYDTNRTRSKAQNPKSS